MFEQVLQSLKDDRDSFKTIFQDYYQPLCHLSIQYLEDEDEAKGVVQEAFMKFWEIRQKLDPDSNIRNFLFTLVKNSCLNLLKRRQILLRHHEKIRMREMHYQYESLSRMGDDYLEFNELKEEIDIAIRKLPEHCRVVFEMSRFEELKNREIAEQLGITPKTVENHVGIALRKLRESLKPYYKQIFMVWAVQFLLK